jgi:hypothetical protein
MSLWAFLQASAGDLHTLQLCARLPPRRVVGSTCFCLGICYVCVNKAHTKSCWLPPETPPSRTRQTSNLKPSANFCGQQHFPLVRNLQQALAESRMRIAHLLKTECFLIILMPAARKTPGASASRRSQWGGTKVFNQEVRSLQRSYFSCLWRLKKQCTLQL